MAEIINIFKNRIPDSQNKELVEEASKKPLSRKENNDIINSIDETKYHYIFALKRSYRFSENLPAVQEARKVFSTWPKEKIASFINENDEAEISRKPALFVTAINIILYE